MVPRQEFTEEKDNIKKKESLESVNVLKLVDEDVTQLLRVRWEVVETEVGCHSGQPGGRGLSDGRKVGV